MGSGTQNGILNEIPARIMKTMGGFYHTSNSYGDDDSKFSSALKLEYCPKNKVLFRWRSLSNIKLFLLDEDVVFRIYKDIEFSLYLFYSYRTI